MRIVAAVADVEVRVSTAHADFFSSRQWGWGGSFSLMFDLREQNLSFFCVTQRCAEGLVTSCLELRMTDRTAQMWMSDNSSSSSIFTDDKLWSYSSRWRMKVQLLGGMTAACM